MIPALNRSDDDEKHGVPDSAASLKIMIASVSEPAIGLSMKTGFLALKTGRTCSRWGRPSTLSSITTSTLSSNSSIDPTISTPCFSRKVVVYSPTRFRLEGMSWLPPGYAATTRTPARSPVAFGPLSSFVNATTCEVSRPMIPARSGLTAGASSPARASTPAITPRRAHVNMAVRTRGNGTAKPHSVFRKRCGRSNQGGIPVRAPLSYHDLPGLPNKDLSPVVHFLEVRRVAAHPVAVACRRRPARWVP